MLRGIAREREGHWGKGNSLGEDPTMKAPFLGMPDLTPDISKDLSVTIANASSREELSEVLGTVKDAVSCQHIMTSGNPTNPLPEELVSMENWKQEANNRVSFVEKEKKESKENLEQVVKVSLCTIQNNAIGIKIEREEDDRGKGNSLGEDPAAEASFLGMPDLTPDISKRSGNPANPQAEESVSMENWKQEVNDRVSFLEEELVSMRNWKQEVNDRVSFLEKELREIKEKRKQVVKVSCCTIQNIGVGIETVTDKLKELNENHVIARTHKTTPGYKTAIAGPIRASNKKSFEEENKELLGFMNVDENFYKQEQEAAEILKHMKHI